MKTNRKSIIFLIILLLFIFRELGYLNLSFYNLHSIHNNGIGTLNDGILAKENYEIDLIWKGEREHETSNPNQLLVKEVSRKGLGWKTYLPLKKETHASFIFECFDKKKNKYLGSVEIHNDYSMKGISSGYHFRERIKAHTKKRLFQYLLEKSRYIDSDIKKDESSWMSCQEVYTFRTGSWDSFSDTKMERPICLDDIDSVQIDTFFFSTYDDFGFKKNYSFEVVDIQADKENILFEVKRFFNNGQLGFHGFFSKKTQEKPNRFSYFTVFMEPTGIWRLWDHNGKIQNSWDFDRMGIHSDYWD